MNKRLLSIVLAVAGLVLAAVVLSLLYRGGSNQQDAAGEPPPLTFNPTSIPAAGGPFSLVDHNGKTMTGMDFREKFLLVFFGYTYCPDICPTELQVISEALDMLGESGGKVQPIFITIDPERDTPEVLSAYVKAFHPRLIGLTGAAEQIAKVAAIYKAGYFKLQAPDSESKGKTPNPGEYYMGHTTSTYLIGPGGKGLFTFPRGIGPNELAKEVANFIGAPPPQGRP